MPFPSARDDDRNYGGRSQRYNMYNQPPEENYARSTKRPSTPPPGVPYTNPNVARYREHVEQHINRSVSQTLSPTSNIQLTLQCFLMSITVDGVHKI